MEDFNLRAQTEVATRHAKGFVSSAVVNPILADQYQTEDYSFCLREIGISSKDSKEPQHFLTNLEAYSIMLAADEGGSGLSLMPLYKIPQTKPIKATSIADEANANGKIIVAELNHVGLPLGITVWIDIESINALSAQPDDKSFTAEQTKQYLKALCDYVLDAGYSVGYYYGNTSGCSCPSEAPTSGNNVLQSISCANGLGESQFHSISIGENNDSCKIRWAYYQ
ncbi:glycoside hydrolase domain-containing protein [Shewanella waksmanii]|uniref:glycoside hydrolase domain-containing protein n=1 Tax=Shewanella waksmanii TaxID=213783 RepID=UPI00048BC0DC|nr:glycoside hydrolase domain-containing protein [Shewanella waksmanii]